MNQHGAKHLLRNVEEPNQHGSLRSFPPSLVHQGHHGKAAESCLHNEGKGAQEAALAGIVIVVGVVIVTRDRDTRRGSYCYGGGGG